MLKAPPSSATVCSREGRMADCCRFLALRGKFTRSGAACRPGETNSGRPLAFGSGACDGRLPDRCDARRRASILSTGSSSGSGGVCGSLSSRARSQPQGRRQDEQPRLELGVGNQERKSSAPLAGSREVPWRIPRERGSDACDRSRYSASSGSRGEAENDCRPLPRVRGPSLEHRAAQAVGACSLKGGV